MTVVAAGQPPVFTGTLTGTYSIKPDGTGTINLGQAPIAFAVTDDGSGLLFLDTGLDEVGGNLRFGTARLQ
jgi:hypothetical protein